MPKFEHSYESSCSLLAYESQLFEESYINHHGYLTKCEFNLLPYLAQYLLIVEHAPDW